MAQLFIVDDDEDILLSLEFWFKKKGFKVNVFENSKTMFEALQRIAPDLILLDVNLKGEDGRDICWQIKNKLHLNSPVILFSANPNVLDEYLTFCADAFVHKPFDLEEITSVVSEHVRV